MPEGRFRAEVRGHPKRHPIDDTRTAPEELPGWGGREQACKEIPGMSLSTAAGFRLLGTLLGSFQGMETTRTEHSSRKTQITSPASRTQNSPGPVSLHGVLSLPAPTPPGTLTEPVDSPGSAPSWSPPGAAPCWAPRDPASVTVLGLPRRMPVRPWTFFAVNIAVATHRQTSKSSNSAQTTS